MRLPKRLSFPFGYVISFKYVTRAEMKELNVERCAHCRQPANPDAVAGDACWDVGTQTIYVVRRLPARRLRYVIGHEMDHAVNDYRLHCVNEGIAQG